MPRLYRPHMPLSVKVLVAERDFSKRFPRGWKPYALLAKDWTLARRLEWLLAQIARAIGCEPKDLRFDHDPPLGARLRRRSGLDRKTYYTPDANDPEHIFARPHGAQFEGSHDVKTRIRGDHGQFSDLALIKRERRRERKKNGRKNRRKRFPRGAIRRKAERPKTRWAKRPFPKRRQ